MKTYIGKGRQREGSAYVVMHLNIEGKKVKCILARMQRPDAYGNTHTVYIPEEEPSGSERYNNRLLDEQEARE